LWSCRGRPVREGNTGILPNGGTLKNDRGGSPVVDGDDVPFCEEEARVDSFVVRVWCKERADASACRGQVEHVQTRSRTYFVGLHRLPAILASYLGMPLRSSRRWLSRLRRRKRFGRQLKRRQKG
jgi:hypothetical protein